MRRGRVCRDLVSRGHAVTGTDQSLSLLRGTGLRTEALREPVPPIRRDDLLPIFVMWRAAR